MDMNTNNIELNMRARSETGAREATYTMKIGKEEKHLSYLQQKQ